MVTSTPTEKIRELIAEVRELTSSDEFMVVVTKPSAQKDEATAVAQSEETVPRMTREALERFAQREPDPDIEEAMQAIRQARDAAHNE